MEQTDGTSDGNINVLLCRQELEATSKKIKKTPECNNKGKHQINSSSNAKIRCNLSHPSIPPPPPPKKHLKFVNYALRKDNIGERISNEHLISTLNNMAFNEIGQENPRKNISLPIEPHQRHVSNSQCVIASSSNVKSPSAGFERNSKEDYKQAISNKTLLKDEGSLLHSKSSDVLLSGSVDSSFLPNPFS